MLLSKNTRTQRYSARLTTRDSRSAKQKQGRRGISISELLAEQVTRKNEA